MADPNLFYFDAPEKITFIQNEFRAKKDSAAAFLYWFPPGTLVHLQAWTQAPIYERAPGMNFLDNWDARGIARSVEGIEGLVMNMEEESPPLYPMPWAPTVGLRGKRSWVQLSVPKLDSTGGTYPQNLNGKWKEGEPQDALSGADDPEEYDQSSPQNLLRSAHGAHTWNLFSSVKAIENAAYRDMRPQVMVFDQVLQDTGCISILDVPHEADGFVTLRTKVEQVTSDNVTYRSIMAQIVRGGGFVSFGYV